MTDLKVGQTKLEGELKTLDAKVDGLGKRIDNCGGHAACEPECIQARSAQEFISRGILTGLIVTIIGGAAKLFGWVNNP